MDAASRAPEETRLRHRIEDARAAEDVAVQSADGGQDDHAGGEVRAARPQERSRRVGGNQRRRRNPVGSEHVEVAGVQAQVEQRDQCDRQKRGERQVSPWRFDLPADVAGGDPPVESEQRSDRGRSKCRERPGMGRRREVGRRAGAPQERRCDQPADHPHQHDQDHPRRRQQGPGRVAASARGEGDDVRRQHQCQQRRQPDHVDQPIATRSAARGESGRKCPQ